MSLLLESQIEDQIEFAHLHERVERLESVNLSERAELESALNEQHESSWQTKAENREMNADRLLTSTQGLMTVLKRSDLPEEVYTAICQAIVTQQLARASLKEGDA